MVSAAADEHCRVGAEVPLAVSRGGGEAWSVSVRGDPHLVWPGGPLEALDDPNVTEVVGRKSAQVAWTSGVLGNALGKWIDLDPRRS